MVEIMDGRVGKHSAEHVKYVINILLHLVIVKYGVISFILCMTLLVKYLVIFHADPCNMFYIYVQKNAWHLPEHKCHALCRHRGTRDLVPHSQNLYLKVAFG